MDDLEVGDLIRARDIEETRAPGWIHPAAGRSTCPKTAAEQPTLCGYRNLTECRDRCSV